jgi:hypothetical protein
MIWKIDAAQCEGHHTNARFTKVAQHALLGLEGFSQYSFRPREMSAAPMPCSRNLAIEGGALRGKGL